MRSAPGLFAVLVLASVKPWCAGRTVSVMIAMVATLLAAPVGVHAGEPQDSVLVRGTTVYAKYCVLCHGASGKGDGRAAALQKVAPADLTASRRSKHYRLQIIRSGGAAMNRSAGMPPWSEVISEQEIADVVVYLEALSSNSARNVAADARDSPPLQGRRP